MPKSKASDRPLPNNTKETESADIRVSDPGESVSRKRFLLICASLFLIVIAIFHPALKNGFQSWYGDDPLYVTDNPKVNTGLTLPNVQWAFTSIDRSNWHPLTWISHMVDCELFGLKPWGHHLTSVLLHAATVVLLFILLRRMTGALWRSVAVALLFGLHPLRVESVAWIAERKDVLSAFFWMLTILLYVRYTQTPISCGKRKAFYGLTLVSFALALLSKAMVVTLPCVLLLLDYWPLRRATATKADEGGSSKRVLARSVGRLVAEKIPLFLLVLAASALTYFTQKSWGFLRSYESYPIQLRVENAVVSYAKYLGSMIWPANLASFYPHPGTWPLIVVFISAAVVLGLTILAYTTRRHRPYIMVGWLWYLGTLVPVIGLVQLGDQAMADRYTYIPMVGILVAAVWAAHEFTLGRRLPKLFWPVLLTALLLPCVILSREHIATFKDGVTRWRHNLEVTGDTTLAPYALGMSLDDQGRTEEAIQHLKAALRAKPDHAQMHMNVATMLQKVQRHDEAIHHYREAVKIEPNFSDARYNLAMSLAGQGQMNESTAELKESVRLNPNDARAYNSLGSFAAQTCRFDEAVAYFKQAVRAKPDYSEAHHNLGLALMDSGRKEEAIKHFQEALRLDPTATDTRQLLESLQQQTPAR